MLVKKVKEEAEKIGLQVLESDQLSCPCTVSSSGQIIVRSDLSEDRKACILATITGRFIASSTMKDLSSKKQLEFAKKWAYHRLLPLYSFIDAYYMGYKTKEEAAKFLGVTLPFFNDALFHHKVSLGKNSYVTSNHIITFEPYEVTERNIDEQNTQSCNLCTIFQ